MSASHDQQPAPHDRDPLTDGDRQVEEGLRSGLDDTERAWLDEVLARHAGDEREADLRGERRAAPLW